MATKTNMKKHTAGAALLLAVLGSMSGLPGFQGVIHSADLFSRSPLYLNDCPVEDEIGANGVSNCRVVNKNKISADVTVEEVVRPSGRPQNPDIQGPPAPGPKRFKVTSRLEAAFCSDGECEMEREVGSLKEAIRLAKEFSNKLAKDAKARQARIDKCEMDEDGNEITKEPKILKCLTDKLKEMDPEQAADYYADNLKERIQALLQSNSPNDRALGMGALGQLGKDLNINCATRPGLQVNAQNSQNQFLTHNLLNPQMNPMRPVSTAGTRPGAERNLIAESTCDMWAFGSYNNNVEHLQLMAAQPGANRPAIGQALRSLKSGWGTYFQQRGMALAADPLGLNGMSGDLMTDYHENNDRLAANMKSIVDKHKDLLEPTTVQNGALTTAGRGARGGVMPHNPTGPGTPSVNPWPGSAPGIPQGRPGMQPAPVPQGQFRGAPRMGTPVGAPGAPPLRR
jgi:hypothetical protein